MKVTKFSHSCLLVESPSRTVLFDPGNYSWEDNVSLPDSLQKLDFIVITHNHPDHYHPPFVKALCEKFPDAQITTATDLVDELKEQGIKNVIHTNNIDGFEIETAPHEPMPFGITMPINIVVHMEGLITNPGDSLHLTKTKDVLVLPITAPWGSLRESLEKVAELKAKKVIPVHDWHWHDAARRGMYKLSKSLLTDRGIEFIEIENAKPVEI